MSDQPTHSRWALWEAEVLSRVSDPEKCREVIRRRQEVVDDDAGEAEVVADQFREELRARGLDPDLAVVFIPSVWAAHWLSAATKTHRATNKATSYLDSLRIPELSKTRKDGRPGWRWRGPQAGAQASMAWLGERRR